MKILVMSAVLAMMVGCGKLNSVSDVTQKEQSVQAVIKEKTGWDSKVTYNSHNGKLIHVAVMFRDTDVLGQTVEQLRATVKGVVESEFSTTPTILFVQIESVMGTSEATSASSSAVEAKSAKPDTE